VQTGPGAGGAVHRAAGSARAAVAVADAGARGGVGRVAEADRPAVGVLRRLQSHPGWLLVLDNVEHRADVEPLLADLTGGHVLITSRRDVGWEDITYPDGFVSAAVA
jgi:hypothetical protein